MLASSEMFIESVKCSALVLLEKSVSVFTERAMLNVLSRSLENPTWTRMRRECFLMKSIFLRILITQTFWKCTSSSKMRRDTILLPIFAKVVSSSMKSSREVNSQRMMPLFLSNKFSPVLTTAMLTILFIEILNLRTFFSKPIKNSTKLKLLISEPHLLLRKERSLMKNSELHTTLLQKSLTRIMAPNVTFGQSVLLPISSFQVSHPLTARLIKKLWRKLNWVSSTLTIHHGNQSLILARTLLLNFLLLTKMPDQVLNKLLSIHSFNLLLMLLKKL